MKKLAMLLAVVMLLSVVCTVFVSAEDPEAYFELVAPGLTDGNMNYSEEGTAAKPADGFTVAVNVHTPNGFNYAKFTINYDATILSCFAATASGKTDSRYKVDTGLPIVTYSVLNSETDGTRTLNTVNPLDFQIEDEETFEMVDVTDATLVFLYFEPLTKDACNATISFSYTEVKSTKKAGETPKLLESEGKSLTIKLNGGAVERTEPLESLGAQVNPAKKAIRFGANFYNLKDKAAVEDLGMLVVSDFRLNGGDLDLDLVNEYVVKVQARGILNYVEGQKLEDYDYVNFIASITDIPDNHFEDDIVARPYVVYADEEVAYSEVMVKNYAEVLAANDN